MFDVQNRQNGGKEKKRMLSIQLSPTINNGLLFIAITFQSDVDHQAFKINILF